MKTGTASHVPQLCHSSHPVRRTAPMCEAGLQQPAGVGAFVEGAKLVAVEQLAAGKLGVHGKVSIFGETVWPS
jgi:hypothetical protein